MKPITLLKWTAGIIAVWLIARWALGKAYMHGHTDAASGTPPPAPGPVIHVTQAPPGWTWDDATHQWLNPQGQPDTFAI